MQTITLESSKEKHMISGREVEIEFKDKSLLKEIVNTPVKGINVEQMGQRIKLLDKIESAKDSLELEDADFEAIKALIKDYQFGTVSKHIYSLCEKFLNPKPQSEKLPAVKTKK